MRPGSVAWVPISLALLLIVASSAAFTPMAVVRADYVGYVPVTANVYDQTGIVASVESLPSGSPRLSEGVTVSDDGLTMDVRWEGGVRHLEPPVIVARDGQQYVIDVNIDGGSGIVSFFAPATSIGLLLGLRFHLMSPITPDQVRLHVHGIFG